MSLLAFFPFPLSLSVVIDLAEAASVARPS